MKNDLGWEYRNDLDSEDEYDLKDKDIYHQTPLKWRRHEDKGDCIALQPSNEGIPTVKPYVTVAPPVNGLSINWVYGYNSFNRNSVKYIGEWAEEIVYPAGKIAVVMWRFKMPRKKRGSSNPPSIEKPRQRYFMAHTDVITTLDVHPDDKYIVASGQRALQGALPQIFIWRTNDLRIKSTLVGFHAVQIKRVKFCFDGAKLVSIGGEHNQKVAVWNWANETLIYSYEAGSQVILDISFLPGNMGLCQVGVKHIIYHEFQSRGLLSTDAELGFKGVIIYFYFFIKIFMLFLFFFSSLTLYILFLSSLNTAIVILY